MGKKNKFQDAQNIKNAENAASTYCKLVKRFESHILHRYDGKIYTDDMKEMRSEITEARKKVIDYMVAIDKEVRDKALKECSYGRRVDSGQIEIHDSLLIKLDRFCNPVDYEEVEVETYLPESFEEVFGKKYDKTPELLGDPNVQTDSEIQE